MKISGKCVKVLREKKGYSLRSFAEKIYTSKSSLQRWEQSELPENGELIEQVAKALDMTVEELYDRSQKNCDSEQEIANELPPIDYEKLSELKYGIKGIVYWMLGVFLLLCVGLVFIIALS